MQEWHTLLIITAVHCSVAAATSLFLLTSVQVWVATCFRTGLDSF